MTTPFLAFDVALSLVRALREPLVVLTRRDPKLADQLCRAAASVPLNVAEGNYRSGRDRLHSFRVAAGSAAEVEAALRVAEAFGYLSAEAIHPAQALADRELPSTSARLRRAYAQDERTLLRGLTR